MPLVPFSALPDNARLWIFSAADPVSGARAASLLAEVDDYLRTWNAHGAPLTCAREWRDDRFLAIGVDQAAAGASGCSIDALFRILREAQQAIGTSIVGSSLVYCRNDQGAVESLTRSEFAARRANGALSDSAHVFDTSLTTVGEYRAAFEKPLLASWHAQLA